LGDEVPFPRTLNWILYTQSLFQLCDRVERLRYERRIDTIVPASQNRCHLMLNTLPCLLVHSPTLTILSLPSRRTITRACNRLSSRTVIIHLRSSASSHKGCARPLPSSIVSFISSSLLSSSLFIAVGNSFVGLCCAIRSWREMATRFWSAC